MDSAPATMPRGWHAHAHRTHRSGVGDAMPMMLTGMQSDEPRPVNRRCTHTNATTTAHTRHERRSGERERGGAAHARHARVRPRATTMIQNGQHDVHVRYGQRTECVYARERWTPRLRDVQVQ